MGVNTRFKQEEWLWLHQVVYKVKESLDECGMVEEDDFKKYKKEISQPDSAYSIGTHKRGIELLKEGFEKYYGAK